MLDNEFCNFLEYQLTSAFENSDDEAVKGFWCDGVILPPNENKYSKKSINDTREVAAIAYMGKSGQEEYQLVIKFGKKAVSRYAGDLDIKDSIPDPKEKGWYIIDPDKKKIVIQLH